MQGLKNVGELQIGDRINVIECTLFRDFTLELPLIRAADGAIPFDLLFFRFFHIRTLFRHSLVSSCLLQAPHALDTHRADVWNPKDVLWQQ